MGVSNPYDDSVIKGTGWTDETLVNIGHVLDFHIPSFTGHIFYVDGTNGDNANDGGIHTPFATIAYAISEALAGDRIVVRAGAYDEALVMNLAGLELICEQGVILSNTAAGGGTPLVVGTANYQRVVGPLSLQAGQTGIQVTGSFCSFENCFAFGSTIGFDDDGLENRFKDCRSIEHTTTGFDISSAFGQYEKCIAATSQAGTTGVSLSNAAADHNHFFDCHTLGNATAGWNVVTDASNNMFSHCSTGAGDGAKADVGTNNTWDEFSEGSKIVAGQTRDQDLKNIHDLVGTIPTTAMRGTDSAALASAWTADLATVLANYTAARAGYLDNIDTKAMGRTQVVSKAWDGRAGDDAGTDDLLEATTAPVIIEEVIVVMTSVNLSDDNWTGISIQDDYATTPHTFIPAADGVKANLAVNAQLAWTGAVYLATGQKITATAIGGDADADALITVIVKYHAFTDGGYLA